MASTVPYKTFEESKDTRLNMEYQGLNGKNLLPILINENDSHPDRSYLAEILDKIAAELRQPSFSNTDSCNGIKADMSKPKRKRKIPKLVSENIFIITFVWQFLCVLALEAIDALMKHKTKKREKPWFILAVIIMVISQASNLILCLSVTLKLFKQYKHKTAGMRFLLHSFIATIFLFAGMYTLTAWILPDAFVGGIMEHHDSKVRALYLYSKLIFVSISTGTLCGAAHVSASLVVTELMMSLQMLLSFLYFASIMSEVVNPSATPPPPPSSLPSSFQSSTSVAADELNAHQKDSAHTDIMA